MEPRLYGRYTDIQSETELESGTVVLNQISQSLTTSSQWHPNGNVRTWKMTATLAELRARAKTIAASQDELGTLGGNSVTTLTFRRLKGYTVAEVIDGKAQGNFYLTVDYDNLYTQPFTVYFLAIRTDHLLNSNPYNTDGEASAELLNFRYTFSNEKIEMPDYFAVYGCSESSKVLTYLGYLERDQETADNIAYYTSYQPIDITEYAAAYLVPSTTNEELKERIDLTNWTLSYHKVEDMLKVFPTYQPCQMVLKHQGYGNLNDYFRGYYNTPSIISTGSYLGSATPDTNNGECTFNCHTQYNTYTKSKKAPLYEGTVQRTYYSREYSTRVAKV